MFSGFMFGKELKIINNTYQICGVWDKFKSPIFSTKEDLAKYLDSDDYPFRKDCFNYDDYLDFINLGYSRRLSPDNLEDNQLNGTILCL